MPRHGVNFTSPRPWNADATEMLPTPVSHRYREHDETRHNVRHRAVTDVSQDHSARTTRYKIHRARDTPAAHQLPHPARRQFATSSPSPIHPLLLTTSSPSPNSSMGIPEHRPILDQRRPLLSSPTYLSSRFATLHRSLRFIGRYVPLREIAGRAVLCVA